MTISDFIENKKRLYKQLEPCYCSAIQEVVHFNSDGLNHLLYDRHRPRNIKEKYYRMGLVSHITEAISKATKAKVTEYAKPPCVLWVLEWVEIENDNGDKMRIKVILKKRGTGNVCFWSVMARKTKKPKLNT